MAPLLTLDRSQTALIAPAGSGSAVGFQVTFTFTAGTVASLVLQTNTAPPGSALNLVNVSFQNPSTGEEVAAGTAITSTQAVILSPPPGDIYAAYTHTSGSVLVRVAPATKGVTNTELYDAFVAAGFETAGQTTPVGMLSAATAMLLGQSLDVRAFGAVGDGVTDDTEAVQAAVDAAVAMNGARVLLPSGVYAISAPITAATNGVSLVGDGSGASDILVLPTFVGSAAIIFGNKASTTVTTSMRIAGLTVDCDNVAGIGGIELYGLRDSSGMEDVYVKDNTSAPGIKTNQAGDGTGAASSRMCEGVQFRNCWVVGGPWLSSAAWQLDGIFESTVIGGGARGFSSTVNTNARGFKIGVNAEARAVTLVGCATVMIKDTGDGSAQTNAGIQYGQWARDCLDIKTTFEGITGPAVDFDGSDTSGAGALPFNCITRDPRVYVYSQGGDDGFGHDTDNFFNPAFRFAVASYCRVERLAAYSSFKVWAEFDAGGTDGQAYNALSVLTSRTPAEISASNVTFDADAATTNWVEGWAAGDTFRLTSEGSGVQLGSDATAARVGLGSTDNVVWEDSAGNAVHELSSTQSIPRVPARNVRNVRYAGGYSTSITPNMANGAHQVYSPNDATAFAINAPTNAAAGDWLYLRFRNISGGALGDITFNAAFKVASTNPWTLTDASLLSKPANGTSRIIAFTYDGTSAWVEAWRSPADVPN